MCKTPDARLLLRLIIDFVILIAVACVALIVLPLTLHTQWRGYFCNDLTIRYPYSGLELKTEVLIILIIALPAAAILIVESLSTVLCTTKTPATAGASAAQQFTFFGIAIPTFISECYKIYGVYLFGLALALITTRITQYRTGRLRPYFIAVCDPELQEGYVCDFAGSLNNSLYIREYNCSTNVSLFNNTKVLLTVRHSFPSVFATTSSYAMIFLVFYLQARLFAPQLRLLRFTLQFACIMIAVAVSIDRVYAYRNHWTDTFAGIGLGCIFAIFIAICILDLLRSRELKLQRHRLGAVDERRIYGYNSVNRNVAKYT